MDQEQLLAILVRFATTLTADFSIQDVLDQLADRVVDLLPVTGAGVLLMDGASQHHFIATTDERIRRIEGLQVTLGEGPCLTAFRSVAAVAIPDLAIDRTHPRFSAAAVEAGLGAVYSFPLRHAAGCIGALELSGVGPVTLTTGELAGAQTLADVVASYLLIARRREETSAASDLLAQAALHDPLTALPNRRLLRDRLDHAVRRAGRTRLPIGIVFGDVDHFKRITTSTATSRGTSSCQAPSRPGSVPSCARRTPSPGCPAMSSSWCVRTWSISRRSMPSRPGCSRHWTNPSDCERWTSRSSSASR